MDERNERWIMLAFRLLAALVTLLEVLGRVLDLAVAGLELGLRKLAEPRKVKAVAGDQS